MLFSSFLRHSPRHVPEGNLVYIFTTWEASTLGRRHEGWTFSGPALTTTVMCCYCSSIQHAIRISHATVMRLRYRHWTLLYLHTASVVNHSHPQTHVPGMILGCFTYPVLLLPIYCRVSFKSTSQYGLDKMPTRQREKEQHTHLTIMYSTNRAGYRPPKPTKKTSTKAAGLGFPGNGATREPLGRTY